MIASQALSVACIIEYIIELFGKSLQIGTKPWVSSFEKTFY